MIESNDLKIILFWPLRRFWSRSATDEDVYIPAIIPVPATSPFVFKLLKY